MSLVWKSKPMLSFYPQCLYYYGASYSGKSGGPGIFILCTQVV